MSEYEDVFGEWLTQTLPVRTFQGPGPKGPVLAAAVPVPKCMVVWKNRLVRASDTEERVSDAQVTTILENAGAFAPESEVILPDGQTRTVLSRAVDGADVPLPHVRVVLV